MTRSVFFTQTIAFLLLAIWHTAPSASAAGIGSKFVQQFSYSDEGVSIGDATGTDIAISGDTAVVGAPFDSAVGRTDAGSAYILVQQGSQWTKQAKLRANDFANRLHFGSCVAISGDTAVIGASPDNYSSYSGAVYVFVRNGTAWSQQARIETSSLPANSVTYGTAFPSAVAVSGDTLVMSTTSTSNYNNAVFVFTRTGTAWQYQSTLLPGPNSNGYGSSLSLSGNTIAVGAAQMTVNGKTSAGAVFVYTGSGHTWTQQATILASDAATSYLFGTSVAIEGDTLLVGSPGRSSNQGAGYLFSRSGSAWSEVTKLTGPLSTDYNQGAGKKVSLSGSVAVLTFSTPSYNYSTSRSNLGWVFSKSGSTWGSAIPLVSTPTLYSYGSTLKSAGVAANGTSVLLAKQSIYASSFADEINAFANSIGQWSVAVKVNLPASGTIELGTSVWVKGGEALVGAPGDADSSLKSTGSVLVLSAEDGGWSLKQKLTPAGGNDGLLFGKAVARDGDIMVVSANAAAYVFEIYNDAWVQKDVLRPGDGGTDQGFGYSVAVLGNTIVVGAPFRNSSMGEAYVFTRSAGGWTEAARLAPADLQTGELFGSSVALTGGMAIVGAPGTSYSGSVQVFQGGASNWLRTAKLLPPAGAGSGFGGVVTVNNDRLLVAATYYDAATSQTTATASGFTLKSGRWQDGAVWMRCVSSSLSSMALDGDFALLAGLANSYYDVKFTSVFAKRSTGWEQVDQIPGGAVALSGNTFLIGDTAPSSDKPESGCATFYAPAAVLSVYPGSSSGTAEIDYSIGTYLGYLVTGKTSTHTFTLRNTGATPLTGLQVTIEGATPADAVVSPLKTTTLAPGASTVLTLTVQPSTGNFDIALKIRSSGGNNSVLTIPVTASVTETGMAPIITNEPGSGMALNDPSWSPPEITLTGDAQGSVPLSFQWKFNGKAIAGATGNTLKLGAPSAKLLGSYTLEVTNPYGKATTAPTTLFWILATPKPLNLTLNEGSTLVLKAPVRGVANIPWYFNSLSSFYQILDDQRITGTSTAQLVMRNLQPADSGDYSVVLGNSQPVIAHVTVRARPRADPGALPPNSTFTWHVGSAVFGGPFLSGDATTRYSATGLPPGVAINSVYGTLSGRPTVAGPYRPSFFATNAAGGSTPVKTIVTVTGLDELLVGTHVGLITPDDAITASLGGTITFTVTSSGAITGSVTVGSKSYKFSTRFIDNPDTSIPYLYCKVALATRPDGKILSLLLQENNQVSGNEVSGVLLLEDGTDNQSVVFETARQQPVAAQTFNPTGSYNVRLNARDPFDTSLPEPPTGTGYLQIKGTRTAFTFAGRLGDGTIISGSAPVLKSERPGFAIPMHQVPYSATGFIQGWLALTADEVTDYDLQWSKDTAVHRSGTQWPDGFSRTYIGAAGGKYTPPARGQRLFGLTGGTIAFDKTVLPGLSVNSDFDFTLSTANAPTLTLLPGNALRPALTINAATGLFSGSINVIAGSPATTRRITFSGVLQEDFTPEAGKGGFVLPPDLPSGLSASGDVWFNRR